jgi:hypothetical protein
MGLLLALSSGRGRCRDSGAGEARMPVPSRAHFPNALAGVDWILWVLGSAPTWASGPEPHPAKIGRAARRNRCVDSRLGARGNPFGVESRAAKPSGGAADCSRVFLNRIRTISRMKKRKTKPRFCGLRTGTTHGRVRKLCKLIRQNR